MLYYYLQLTLYAPEPLELPANVFETWPESLISREKSIYLQDYHKQKPTSHMPSRDRPRRQSRKQMTGVSMPNTPPTPLCSPKHHTKRSLIGRIDGRFGAISLETIDNRSYADATKSDSSVNSHEMKIHTSNLGYGILHLYRDAPGTITVNLASGSAASPVVPADDSPSTVVCALAVPTYFSTSEFLSFVAPFDTTISHYRIIRDIASNKYSVLLKFRDPESAHSFQQKFNGRHFKTMEPELCHVVFIKTVYMNSVTIPPMSFPFLNKTLEDDRERCKSLAESGERLSRYELPTCPVCLERMDDRITGLTTIVCEHAYHCYCLSKWGDGSCSACRYSQKPVLANYDENSQESESIGLAKLSLGSLRNYEREDDLLECYICGATESLWICMICGHIGCGRYQDAHAYDHYMETNHLYALEIETQCVWDYAGDGYVHRLIQNTLDGKLLEFPSSTRNDTDTRKDISKAKTKAMEEEYSALLTSQLDSQRLYYEEHIDDLMGQLSNLTEKVDGLTSKAQFTEKFNNEIRKQISQTEYECAESTQEKENIKASLDQKSKDHQQIDCELQKEKQMTTLLLEELDQLSEKHKNNKIAIKETCDQVRDLKFFIEARGKVQNNPELEGGNVETQQVSSPLHPRKSKKKGKR